jgi:hypothetical protein
MSEDEKVAPSGVYGQPGPCQYRRCGVNMPKPYREQKFCCKEHKRLEHRAVYEDGLKMKSGGKNHPSMEAPALKIMLDFLGDGKVHTSKEIIMETDDCDHRSTIAGLRHHGYNIPPAKYLRRSERGRNVFGYQLIREG